MLDLIFPQISKEDEGALESYSDHNYWKIQLAEIVDISDLLLEYH